ncbi:hypothetical protein C3L50_00725 [Flavobacterium alvei]|uniref:Lipoprotein n=1 Tax=Flavobacterium alvei TaxID=2080416 RepID=A0A2S5AEY3_9FLAO|nr:hypothetical protein [Flavobacterium alvei]POY41085.1 hypothetical protein C3L50_00725 [Flavobacterium alvei]
MKNIILFFLGLMLISCSIQSSSNQNAKKKSTAFLGNNLIDVESNIINSFLNVELEKERYKNYKDFEIVVIEEALKKYKSIEAYQYSCDEWISMDRINKIGDIENRFFLDTLQIKKIKIKLEKEEVYHWKVSDFKNIGVNLLKYEELRNIINTGAYITLPSKLIIYLSKPLIIDENNAFISFEIGNGQLGFSSINHFTVLMRKVNSKWEQSVFYEDGVFN